MTVEPLPELSPKVALEVEAAAYWARRQPYDREGKELKTIGDRLKRWLHDEDNDDQLIEPETGKGVALEPAGRTVNWDTRNLTDEELQFLRDNGLLQINNSAYDSLRKVGGAATLDAIERLRWYCESARPMVRDDERKQQ